MASRRKAVGLNFLAQIASQAFVIAQGIFLVPLYLRFLSVSLYGAWLASVQLVGWVTLLDPGTDEVTRQRVALAHGRGDTRVLGTLIGTGLTINALVAVCVTTTSIAFTIWLPTWIRLSANESYQLIYAARILAIASGLTVVSYAAGSCLQALQETGLYGGVLIIGNVAGLATNLSLLYNGWGVSSIAAGVLVRALVSSLGWSFSLLWVCRSAMGKSIRLRLSASEAKTLFRLAGYTLLAKLSSMLHTGSDNIVTGLVLGSTHTAVLQLTSRIIDAARIVPDRIGAAMQPALSSLFGENNDQKSAQIAVKYLVCVSVMTGPLVAAAVGVNREAITLWVGPHLFGGPFLSISFGLVLVTSIMTTAVYHILFSHGLIEVTAKASLATGLAKILILVIFMPMIGLPAVPLASLLALLAVMVPTQFCYLNRISKLERWRYSKLMAQLLGGPVLCVLIAVWLAQFIHAATWPAVAGKAAVIATATFILQCISFPAVKNELEMLPEILQLRRTTEVEG